MAETESPTKKAGPRAAGGGDTRVADGEETLRLYLRKIGTVALLTRELVKQPVSLEAPVVEDSDGRLGDQIADDDARDPEQAAVEKSLRENLSQVLSTLSLREQQILRMRFGMGENDSQTLDDVGRKFSVTRERIRQLEARALEKVRRSSHANVLRRFV